MPVNQELSPIELDHYSRHLKLPGFGLERQLSLKAAKVLLVGAGGLGCPIGLYLAAAGVGTIGVVDFDQVERSNLQRQVAHTVERVGQPKVESLILAMRALNPLVNYVPHAYRLSETNIQQTMTGYDLVLDGSDNFGTRFLVADACHLAGIPLLQGAVHQYQAQISLFVPGEGACYRCVFREPPQQPALAPCAEVGVLGVVPGTSGLMMATEAIKFLSGLPTPAQGNLLRYDAMAQTLRHMPLQADADCPLCGPNPAILEAREELVVCPGASVVDTEIAVEMDVEQAQAWVKQGALLLDVRDWFEFDAGHLPHALNLPLSQVAAQAGTILPLKDTALLVYCQKGSRSLEAVLQLRALGYSQSFSLTGGIGAWREPAEATV
jgi:molybdopterin/thiamine biosynthesis adenylyltransferase/rhodanese-related sulfurtransferase